MAFCRACARQQEAYFVIGDLTQIEMEDLRGRALAEALVRMRQERAGSTKDLAAGIRHGHSGVDEIEPLALGNS